jgi:hypothetical protein
VVDVFEEVEEELRADRLKTLAKRILPWALLGLVLGLLVAGAIYGWRAYQRSGAEAASLAYAGGLEKLGAGTPRAPKRSSSRSWMVARTSTRRWR